MDFDISNLQQPGANVQAPDAQDAAVLSGQTQTLPPVSNPAAVAASTSAMPAGQTSPSMAAENAATQPMQPGRTPTPEAPAAAPTPPPPHARLLAMVQGLSIGLSAAAKSIATHGQEGGAAEVIRIQGEQQAQRQSQQAAAAAQKNNELQQKIMTGELARQNAQNYITLSTMHDEVNKSHFEAQSAQQGVISGAQDIRAKALQDLEMTGDLGAYNKTLQQLDTTSGAPPTGAASAAPGAAPVAGVNSTVNGAPAGPSAPAVTIPPMVVARWKNSIDAATSAYPNDPAIKHYASVLSDPKSAPTDMALAAAGAKSRMSSLDAGAESRTKQEAAQAGARPKDLNDATGRLTQAQQAYKTNPNPTTKSALDVAKDAQTEFLTADRRQKQIAQDIQNGDPAVIGSAMANGLYAPSQVLSARSMSKPFYSKVIAAANDAAKANGAPEILGPNGQHTGQYFNAAVAEGQYKYSTNVQTQNTLNKILTLNETGGDLDILKDATTALPKMNNKTINQIFNAGATEFGSPEATNYHMALYNLASLLAQVQTGGIPTEGEIQQQLNLMNASFSKGQLDGAIQIARRDIAARGTSMVSNNPYLRAAYPSLNSNSSGKAVSLKAAMALPINKGKTESQVRADILSHGHEVGE